MIVILGRYIQTSIDTAYRWGNPMLSAPGYLFGTYAEKPEDVESLLQEDLVAGQVLDSMESDTDLTSAHDQLSDLLYVDNSDASPTDSDSSDSGTSTDGDALDGDSLDGTFTDGDAPDGYSLDGTFTNGDTPDGDSLDGTFTDGDALDGHRLEDDTPDSDSPHVSSLDGGLGSEGQGRPERPEPLGDGVTTILGPSATVTPASTEVGWQGSPEAASVGDDGDGVGDEEDSDTPSVDEEGSDTPSVDEEGSDTPSVDEEGSDTPSDQDWSSVETSEDEQDYDEDEEGDDGDGDGGGFFGRVGRFFRRRSAGSANARNGDDGRDPGGDDDWSDEADRDGGADDDDDDAGDWSLGGGVEHFGQMVGDGVADAAGGAADFVGGLFSRGRSDSADDGDDDDGGGGGAPAASEPWTDRRGAPPRA
ncbi:clumping factor A-like [Pollicipes pollicipes]|uniref:clumping factor A-like n=1 Tax=Pollicipes pollicipes TaxID=41117 RepID=UPI0018856E60|nr:clumping factor A-like [Pollicipes pollicipes]